MKSINAERLFSLFTNMINLYSPSGREEMLTRYLLEYLEGRGMNLLLRPVDDQRSNIEVSKKHAHSEILFLGHIDTVPAFNIEDYQLQEIDGLCYGLGAADMKGGCAALIEAFISAFEGGYLPDSVMLSLVVGEEEAGDGTKALLDAYKFTHAIVAEPTNLYSCLEHYGYIEIVLHTYGSRKHAAMSERESHTIRSLLILLLALDTYVQELSPQIILNIRDLMSSESGFAVPDHCSATVDIHIPPDWDVYHTKELLSSFIEQNLSVSPANSFSIEMPFISCGYTINKTDPLASYMQQVYSLSSLPWKTDAFRSHSDANLLKEAGCIPIICGPGSLAAAHTRDEHIAFEEVIKASIMYANLLALLYDRS